MPYLVAFETLQDRNTQLKAMGHDVKGAPTIKLQGWREKVRAGDYHTIERDERGTVKGKLLEVSGNDLRKLDAWENRYNRIKVGERDGAPVFAYQLKGDGVAYKKQESKGQVRKALRI